MKRLMTALLAAAALMLPLGAQAEGAVRADGRIEAVRTQTIMAPHTGLVGDFTVRAGDALGAGEALFTLGATEVYAEFDGTVTAVFAEPGDSAAYVQDRYGALCYAERGEVYTAQCNTNNSGNENENKIVHVGEFVYLKSTASDDRRGEARITSVEGKNYTLDVLSERNMRLNEQVKVYRESDCESSSCIGSGKLTRIDPVGITAEGYVRSVYVSEGDTVARGDLLFEMVPDAMPGMQGSNGSVCMPADGVVLSVLCESGVEIAKDAPMATFCERSDLRLICAVDEEDLARIAVGMEFEVALDAYREETMTGVIEKIAGASAEEDGAASFDVTVRLPENDKVRIGMNATAAF